MRLPGVAGAGAQGDGETCDMCTLGLVIQSSTVVEGKVRRAFQNQVIGSLTGLDDAACVPSSETTFHLMLEGSPEGVVYIFSLEIHKAGRTASASAQVTMTSGPLPVPTITALPGKVNANQRVVLSSTVESDAPGTVTRAWSVTEEAGTAVLNLSASAATALTGVDLVVGGAYIFKLSVEDSWGPASSSLRVVVNRPPQPGSFTVTPAQGTVLNTTFQMLASDWVDEDNTPLWYQLSYVVTGGTSATQEMLNEYKPDPSTSSMLPEEGLEVAWREVQVFVSVRDALGAVASASAAVVVAPGAELSDTELTSFVDDNLAAGEVAAANGDADTSMLLADGLAAMLNTAANTSRARRRTLLKDAATAAPETELVAARSAQRESMMDLLSGGKASLVPTDSSLERLASSTQKVVATPEELAPALQ
eukprot:gene1955-2638_t